MKMFRLFAGMIAILMVMLTGCSNQSPDFTSELKSIQISYTALTPRSSGKIAVGDQLQFTATGLCTTPPGTKATDPGVVSKTIGTKTLLLKPCGVSVSDVTWKVDTSGNGSIDATTGLFTAGPGVGSVVVTGTANGLTDSSTVNTSSITVPVTPVVLDHISVDPKSPPPVAQNGTVTFTVTGVGSDGKPFTLVPSSITWSPSCAATVATIAPTTNSLTTVATAVAATGTCTITATSTNNVNGDTIAPASATFTISNDVALKHLVSTKLTPPSAAIAVGGKQDYQLMGVYGDGSTHAVPNSAINWTMSSGGVATLADNATDSSKETATGAKIGQATITATLKDPSTLDDPTKKSATGTLTVVDAACTTPLSNQNTPVATTTVPPVTGPLCLICGVADAGNVIDADPTNAATLSATLGVGLPSNGVSLIVNSNATSPFPAGGHAGFLVADPTGALLSANVLNGNIQVSTLAGGIVQESSTPYVPGGLLPLPPLLDVTLLGLGNGGAYVTIPATKPYDAIKVTFNTGLVSALSAVKVVSACATVDLTKVTP